MMNCRPIRPVTELHLCSGKARDMKRPPGWLIAVTAFILLCVGGSCLVGGIKLRGAGARDIDKAVTPIISAQIAGNSVAGGSMRIYEPDLDINTETVPTEGD